MATQKLYAGVKLRETRTRLGLTQKAFAEKLGVSLPYLNQMENNNRPVSPTVVLALAGMLIIPATVFQGLALGAILVVISAVMASLTSWG